MQRNIAGAINNTAFFTGFTLFAAIGVGALFYGLWRGVIEWRKALLQTVRGTKKHSVREKLTSVTCPTLVICGKEDQSVNPMLVQEAIEGLPNFSLELIPRCGHAPQLEVPQIVNPIVTQFLLAGDEERKSRRSIRQKREVLATAD